MSDNRTAEQILKDHGLGNSTVYSVTTPNGYSYSTIDAMEEYASQQTARLREENERLHQRINLLCMGIDEAVALTEENSDIKQLQEEVERLSNLNTALGYEINAMLLSESEYLSMLSEYSKVLSGEVGTSESKARQLHERIKKALSSKESKPS